MCFWICVVYFVLVLVAFAVFLVYLFGQGLFFDGMFLGIFGIFNFMFVFQAEYNIFMYLFYMVGVVGMFGGFLFLVMYGLFVILFLIREIIEIEF